MENRDEGKRRTLRSGIAPAVALAVTLLASTIASAQGAEDGAVELWVADAPLRTVLEHVAGRDGVRVVVGDEVEGRVDGRLDGSRETVLATLAVEHELSVHAEGETVWFDPVDRPVVSLLRLAPEETERALAALEPETGDESVAQGTGEGVVLSGSRAFVERARRRIAALAPAPAAEGEAPATNAARAPGVRSVTDIPGYHVDYAAEGAS